jgi:hypothetical protein
MAARFPGALRELDTLGQAELERRALAAARAAHAISAPGHLRARTRRHVQVAEYWMPWIAAVHAVLRAVLVWRRRYGRSKPRPAARAGDRLSLPSGAGFAGFALTQRDEARLLCPPGGRTLPVVLALVARRFRVSEGVLARRLFPARRRTPAARD